MRLAYYHDGDQARWGAADAKGTSIRLIGGRFDEWAPEVTRKGSGVLSLEGPSIPLNEVRLLPPLIPTAEIIGSGINYSTWALPPKGVDTCFEYKSHSAFIGAGDIQRYPDMMIERPQCEYRYELELGLIIGETITEPTEYAIKKVLGYTVVNDGCLRHQRANYISFDWTGSKCGFQASAAGPWIVTRDEFGDEQPDLRMVTRVDGVVTQDGRTGDMVWDVNRLLHELSWRMELRPGDLLFTGTPGYTELPDGITKPGNAIEFEIERIGVIKTSMENRNLPGDEAGDEAKVDFGDLLTRAYAWDGASARTLKPILVQLGRLDPNDLRGWKEPLRAELVKHNANMWPAEKSSKFDWWAIDSAYMRLYTEPSGSEFKQAAYVPDRQGGTP